MYVHKLHTLKKKRLHISSTLDLTEHVLYNGEEKSENNFEGLFLFETSF